MPRPRDAARVVSSRTTFLIMGMFDNAGRERVHDALEGVEGVRDVQVSLHRASAVVRREGWCRPGDLAWSVLTAGYGVWLENDAVLGRARLKQRAARRGVRRMKGALS